MKRPSDTKSLLERLAELGEVVRLRVLRLMEAEELSVGEISRVVQLPQSTVSRHLKVLLDGGWVTKRSEGTATMYRLVQDDLPPEHRGLWRTVREQMGSDATLEEDLRRLRGVMEERKTDSQTFFGRYGGQWDEMRGELFGSRFTPLALLALLRRDWVVADLGCGTGNVAELLAPVVERVVAVDVSGSMLESARRRLAGVKNVEFVERPIHGTGLEAGSIDVAACCLVLHHHPRPSEALREMRRVLRGTRGGGMALIVDMVRHDRTEYRRMMGHEHLGFGKDEISPMMKDAGFDRVEYRELPAEPSAKGPGLFVAVGWM
jgi:SAM-dependent methyltransferase